MIDHCMILLLNQSLGRFRHRFHRLLGQILKAEREYFDHSRTFLCCRCTGAVVLEVQREMLFHPNIFDFFGVHSLMIISTYF